MKRRTKNNKIAGTTPTMNSARQPQRGMMKILSAAAITRPTGNAAMMLPVMLPRIRPGLNSELSVNVTGTSPPSPKFDKNRKTVSEAIFHDTATRPVNTANSPTVA